MFDWMQRFVVIDVETTGFSPTHDRVIELGFALFEHGRFVKRGDWFVNPGGRAISQEITDLTGISFENVCDAPPFYDAWNQMAPYVYGATPIGWNAPFDRAFLFTEIARAWPRAAFGELPWLLQPDIPWVDAQLLARAFWPQRKSGFKLGQVVEACGMHIPEAHRADEDARAAGSVLLYMIGQTTSFALDALWSWPRMIDRQMSAAIAHAERQWFWQKRRELEARRAGQDVEVQAYLPQGHPIEVYQCDVCHRMSAGRYVADSHGTRWTKPEGWVYYGGPGVADADKTACSPACELVAGWHRGYHGGGGLRASMG